MNGDTKAADTNKSTKNDINQNSALENATPAAQDTSNLSESTIQAFRETLHYKPLSQCSAHDTAIVQTHTANDRNGEPVTEENGNMHVNCAGRTDLEQLDNRALFQGISLKDFEKHHKLMKEANLEKRKLLSSAIEQRYALHFH